MDDACRWAAGRSTAADVARYTTTGLYYAQRFAYDGSGTFWTLPTDQTVFRLTDFLNNGGWQSGDCRDVPSYLCICARALGLSFNALRLNSTPSLLSSSAGPFDTNPICPIGDDSSNAGAYQPTSWNFHQKYSFDGTIYDACSAQRYWPSGAPFFNPPRAWDKDSYWQSTVPTSIGTAWNPVGLVALPNPSAATTVGTYCPSVQ